jgi:hypothetical protein
MFAADSVFVFEDLRQQGLLTTVQVERTVASGRNARGHRTGARTPVGDPAAVYIAAGSSALLAAALGERAQNRMFGERVRAELTAVCPPGTDVQPDDELVALDGAREGTRYRVVEEPEGVGSASPVLVLLERMREDA